MKLKWFGQMEGSEEIFPASVPGNIQNDYARFKEWGDINYADNCLKYLEIEDAAWLYHTSFDVARQPDESVFFETKGIDYEYEIFLNGASLCRHEGLYTSLSVEITDRVKETENRLSVKIFPHPKRAGAPVSRTQADNCVKPPVGYGWDWHPRVIPSGIWNDTGITVRKKNCIKDVKVAADLSKDLKTGTVRFDFSCAGETEIRLFAPDGTCVSSGSDRKITVNDPLLWWCNGHGGCESVYLDGHLLRRRGAGADRISPGGAGNERSSLGGAPRIPQIPQQSPRADPSERPGRVCQGLKLRLARNFPRHF